MSFILDALKKSESERQQQAGPSLYEVRIAAPPARFPVWAVALGVLLGINVVAFVVWAVMRGGDAGASEAAGAAAARGAQAAVISGRPSQQTMGMPIAGTGAAGAPPDGAAIGGGAEPQPGRTTAASGAVGAQGAAANGAGGAFNPPLVEDPSLADGELPVSGTYNASDYQPAEQGAAGATSAGGYARSGAAGAPGSAGSDPVPRPPSASPRAPADGPGLPSRDDLVAAGSGEIPPVALSLHVFDHSPTRRFAMVNNQRLREGESLPDGLRLEEITAQGAVMSWRGTRFLVTLQ